MTLNVLSHPIVFNHPAKCEALESSNIFKPQEYSSHRRQKKKRQHAYFYLYFWADTSITYRLAEGMDTPVNKVITTPNNKVVMDDGTVTFWKTGFQIQIMLFFSHGTRLSWVLCYVRKRENIFCTHVKRNKPEFAQMAQSWVKIRNCIDSYLWSFLHQN